MDYQALAGLVHDFFSIYILQRLLLMVLLAALPGLRSILNDGRGLRLADVIAGIITGLVLVPQAVAFAQLALISTTIRNFRRVVDGMHNAKNPARPQ